MNHRRIGKIEDLDNLKNLEKLYLRWNLIKKIENLEDLWLNDNQIDDWPNIDVLSANKKLTTIYLSLESSAERGTRIVD